MSLKRFIISFFPLAKQAKIAGVHMGTNNFVASKFWGTEPYLITVGSHCQLTQGCKLLTHGGGGAARRYSPKFDCFGKVTLGDYVYVGANSLVMPGCSIGDNVLIAAGSIVTKSVPSNCVVAGNPARFVCTIEEYMKRNAGFNLDSKGLSSSEKRRLLLSLPDEKFISKREIDI